MKAYELSKEKMEKLSRDCMELIQNDKAGCDARTMLKDMYCKAYPDKTEDIGYLMGDRVIGYVKEYEQDVLQAMENPDGWYEEKVQAILAEKESCKDRCNALYKVRVGLTAAEILASKGKEASEAYIEEHSKKAFTGEEATGELEAKLKEELKNKLGNSGMLASAFNAYVEHATDEADDIERLVIKYGEENAKFKALLAMKSYIESGEDGYLEDVIPADATLKDITYSICASVDSLGVATAVENGDMEESLASKIIHAIGMVLGAIAALKIAFITGGAIFTAGSVGILAFIGGIIVTVAVFETIADALIETGGKVADVTKSIVCFGARCACAVGRTIFAGIKRLAGFFGQEDEQDNTQEIFEYTEPGHERTPEVVKEVMPAPAVLA